MLKLEHDADQLSLTERSDSSDSPVVSPTDIAPTVPHSAPVSPAHRAHEDLEVGYPDPAQRGFFEGLLGCLRPVWTIIGKATAAELKQQGNVHVYHSLLVKI